MNTMVVLRIKQKQALRDRTKAADWLHGAGIRTLEGNTDPLGRNYRDWPEEHEASYGTNLLSTLACRRIRPTATNFVEQTILAYVRAHVRVAGLEKAMEWLEDFRKEVESMGPTKLLQEITMMPAELPGHCTCSIDGDDVWWHSPVLIWIHDNHYLYNKAMWEIMVRRPGQMRRLRRALRDDLHFPDRTIGGDDQIFGHHLDKSYASQLLGFITSQPDPAWIVANTA